MAMAYLFEIPGVSQEQGAAIIQAVGGKAPAGQILHIEGPMEGGLRVVDVWESQAALDTFLRDQLMPALQRMWITFPPDFGPKAVWPVSGLLKA